MRRALSFFAGVIMGSLVGATIAILLAPASGDDMRMQIKDRFTEIQKEIQQAVGDRRAELEAQLSALRTPPEKQ
jgi:gas vesicle protein